MSPLQVLVLPDALHSRNQGHIRPGCPVVGSRTASRRTDGNSPSFSLLFLQLSPICWKSPPRNLYPLRTFIFSLPVVHSVTVCFTLDCPPLSFPLTHVDYLSLFYCSLFLVRCLPLSGKQLFLSARPTLCPFTVSSSCSLTPPRLLLFIPLPLSVPLSSPLIPLHSVFNRLCSLSQFG